MVLKRVKLLSANSSCRCQNSNLILILPCECKCYVYVRVTYWLYKLLWATVESIFHVSEHPQGLFLHGESWVTSLHVPIHEGLRRAVKRTVIHRVGLHGPIHLPFLICGRWRTMPGTDLFMFTLYHLMSMLWLLSNLIEGFYWKTFIIQE
jgi:hypothetical protein